jgi:hypothetical protein
MVAHPTYPSIDYDPILALYDWDQTYDHIPRSQWQLLGLINLRSKGIPSYGNYDRFSYTDYPWADDYSTIIYNFVKQYAYCPFNSLIGGEIGPYFTPGAGENFGTTTIADFDSTYGDLYDKDAVYNISLSAGQYVFTWLYSDTDNKQNGVRTSFTYNKAYYLLNLDQNTTVDLNTILKPPHQEDSESNIFCACSLVISELNLQGDWVEINPSMPEPFLSYSNASTYFSNVATAIDTYLNDRYVNHLNIRWFDRLDNPVNWATFDITASPQDQDTIVLVFNDYCFPKGNYLKRLDWDLEVFHDTPFSNLNEPVLTFEAYPSYITDTFFIRYANQTLLPSDVVKAPLGITPIEADIHQGILQNSGAYWRVISSSTTPDIENFDLAAISVSQNGVKNFPYLNDSIAFYADGNVSPINGGTSHTLNEVIDSPGFINSYHPALYDHPSSHNLLDDRYELKINWSSFTNSPTIYDPLNGFRGRFVTWARWEFPQLTTNFMPYFHYFNSQGYARSTTVQSVQYTTTDALFSNRVFAIQNLEKGFEVNYDIYYGWADRPVSTISINQYYTQNSVTVNTDATSQAYASTYGVVDKSFTDSTEGAGFPKTVNISLESFLLGSTEYANTYVDGAFDPNTRPAQVLTQLTTISNNMVDSLRVKQIEADMIILRDQVLDVFNTLGSGDFATYLDGQSQEQPIYMSVPRNLDLIAKAMGISYNPDGTILPIDLNTNPSP